MDDLIRSIWRDYRDYSAVALRHEAERRKLVEDYTIGGKKYSKASIEKAFEIVIEKKHHGEDGKVESRIKAKHDRMER